MRSFYRYLLISLLIIAALVGAFQFGYFVSDAMRTNKESTAIHRLNKRIRELEEREKSKSASEDNGQKPPKTE